MITNSKPVGLIPEHAASRIVAIQERLQSSHVLALIDREHLAAEQTALWDECFPGKAYEDIRALAAPFLLAA